MHKKLIAAGCLAFSAFISVPVLAVCTQSHNPIRYDNCNCTGHPGISRACYAVTGDGNERCTPNIVCAQCQCPTPSSFLAPRTPHPNPFMHVADGY